MHANRAESELADAMGTSFLHVAVVQSLDLSDATPCLHKAFAALVQVDIRVSDSVTLFWPT